MYYFYLNSAMLNKGCVYYKYPLRCNKDYHFLTKRLKTSLLIQHTSI